jgi:hypothetical protein
VGVARGDCLIASKPRANEAPPGRHRAAARAPDRGPSGVQWAAGLTSIKIWKGPEAATANLRRSRGSLGRDNLPRAKLADQGHRPTDTQRAVGVMVFRSPLHVAAALPGENLGRIHAAGERVGRLGRIRRHARERRRKTHLPRSATDVAESPQLSATTWTTSRRTSPTHLTAGRQVWPRWLRSWLPSTQECVDAPLVPTDASSPHCPRCAATLLLSSPCFRCPYEWLPTRCSRWSEPCRQMYHQQTKNLLAPLRRSAFRVGYKRRCRQTGCIGILWNLNKAAA